MLRTDRKAQVTPDKASLRVSFLKCLHQHHPLGANPTTTITFRHSAAKGAQTHRSI